MENRQPNATSPEANEAAGAAEATSSAVSPSDTEAAPAVADTRNSAEVEPESVVAPPEADAGPEFPDRVSATVRRGVNMRAFLVLGLVVGVILAIVLTYAFPEHPDFTRGQVLGFLLVFVTALSAIAFIGIGAIIELFVGRKRREIELKRADVDPEA